MVLPWLVGAVVIVVMGALLVWLGPPDDIYDVFDKEDENE